MTSLGTASALTAGPEAVRIGVDVGGTNTKIVVVQGDRVIDRRTGPTARGVPSETVAGVGRFISQVRSGFAAVAGIGVTMPGHCDADGVAIVMPNLPGAWDGTPVRAPLEAAAGNPVVIVNDARAFGQAEATLGAARGAQTAVGLVLGTGIGGVVIVGGRVHGGAAGQAGEIGHQVLARNGPECGCGNRGCLESLARSGAITQAAGHTTVESVVRAAERGEEPAVRAINEAANWIGIGIANIVTVLQPEVVFLGGGVVGAGDLLLAPIRAKVRESSPLVPPSSYRIAPAALGAWAGAIGAALSSGRFAG